MSRKINKIEEIKEEVPAEMEVVIPKGVEPMAKARKIGVVRYLQDHPQAYYVEILMKKNYAMQAHTIPEWDQIAIDVTKKRY